jgi:flagellar hook-associated protein 3 FlgL
VLTVRALVGAREQQLATLKTDNSTSQLGFSSTLSNLTDTDIVSAYSQYTETSVALQAAEKTFVQTESLTLFSIIQ